MINCNSDCFLKSCEEHIADLKGAEIRLNKNIHEKTKELNHVTDKRKDLEQLIINWKRKTQ